VVGCLPYSRRMWGHVDLSMEAPDRCTGWRSRCASWAACRQRGLGPRRAAACGWLSSYGAIAASCGQLRVALRGVRADGDHRTTSASRSSVPSCRCFRFHARDAHLVLSRSTPEPIPFRVHLDGEAPVAPTASTSTTAATGILDDGRLYELMRQRDGVSERTLEISFLERGAEAFAFKVRIRSEHRASLHGTGSEEICPSSPTKGRSRHCW
jgi:Thioredoxin like C-terminal domain